MGGVLINDTAIKIIIEYVEKYLFEPKWNWPKYYFNQRSYGRWAADEILGRLMKQESTLSWDLSYQELKTPIDIITEFIDEMEKFIELGRNEATRTIFITAKETATDILDLLM